MAMVAHKSDGRGFPSFLPIIYKDVTVGSYLPVTQSVSLRWEEEKYPDGIKWKFLEHKGPYFPPEYQPLPDDVRFFYNGGKASPALPAGRRLSECVPYRVPWACWHGLKEYMTRLSALGPHLLF